MRLSEHVIVKPRFSRSANVERDLGLAAIDGYLPTGRALDVVARIGRGLLAPAAGRTLAITGPHGGGKSSLAVFLDALLAPRGSAEHKTAHDILRAADPAVSDLLAKGMQAVDSAGHGAVRAFVTASLEPVTVTVARALHIGAGRALGAGQTIVPAAFGDERTARGLTAREICDVMGSLCAVRPVVLVIDEFGKNLETFAKSAREGDPYLLQALAEATQGEPALPLVIVTMQHLAFDEYAQDASVTRRREWAKVQGRFQDIPYVETASQSRRLIAAAIETTPGALATAVHKWYQLNAGAFAAVGLRDLRDDAEASYPLHPLALAVLPDLCARYGQNERTLFSFMASAEPLAVPAFLRASRWSAGQPLPLVGLDRVYDYFLDSASTMISASATASRWLEIETRIRDTTGLSEAQLSVLKAIGVLNLVSSAGALRASRRLLELAANDGRFCTLEADDLAETLRFLESAGLITYRDFADEYRIWQGSDFDLQGEVNLARRTCRGRSLAALLNEAAPLELAVAGHHSQRTGVLRVFQQRFSDLSTDDLSPAGTEDPHDGTVLYATVSEMPEPPAAGKHQKPVAVVLPGNPEAVRDVAVEAAALRMALSSAEADKADWVARRELVERAADAQQALRREITSAWNPAVSTWYLLGRHAPLLAQAGVSATLSLVADHAYSATPRVANEMIARRELTSQGAKARRMLIEAFLARGSQERFGIEGYGPDRAIYEAVYRATGLHRRERMGDHWVIAQPTARHWDRVWSEVEAGFEDAKGHRIGLDEIAERLKLPPIGLKDGILPILLVTALAAHSDEVALYEHGSLLLGLDDAVAERLARNLGHFAVKNTATKRGGRQLVVAALSERLGLTRDGGRPTFLHMARALYRELHSLPPFTQQTRRYVSEQAAAVREAFRTAVEPDALIFETLPGLLGCPQFPAMGNVRERDAESFAARLMDVVLELRAAYNALLNEIRGKLAEATAVGGGADQIRRLLAGQAVALEGRVLEPRLRAFVTALARPLDDHDWLANTAMVVADGQAPRLWTDDLAARFPLLVADLGGAFRRTQALLYDRLALSNDGYRSRRLTLTKPDGRETSQVLVLSDHDRALVDEHIGPILDQLATVFGSRSAACQTLLANLATLDDDFDDLTEAAEPSAKEA